VGHGAHAEHHAQHEHQSQCTEHRISLVHFLSSYGYFSAKKVIFWLKQRNYIARNRYCQSLVNRFLIYLPNFENAFSPNNQPQKPKKRRPCFRAYPAPDLFVICAQSCIQNCFVFYRILCYRIGEEKPPVKRLSSNRAAVRIPAGSRQKQREVSGKEVNT
jgi:hypothetical protein